MSGKYFNQLATPATLSGHIGVAQTNPPGLTGYQFPYSSDGALTTNSDAVIPTQKAIKTYADTKAADNAVVHLAGTETITGDKSFTPAVTLTGGVKDANVTTAIHIGDSTNTSFSTTNKTIAGASNELRSQKNWNHTGLVSGGTLSINGGDNTKFDVAAGSGKVMDLTNPANPVEYVITWSAQTGLTTPYLATLSGTWVGYSRTSAAIVTSASDFTVTDLHNDIIRLGRLSHFGNTVITGVYQLPLFYYADLEYLCLGNLFGVTNLQGNGISANGANLKINKSQGLSFRTGANVTVDANNPNYPTTTDVSQVTFLPAYRSTTSGRTTLQTATTNLNPNNYDNGTGTLASVTASYYTIQTALFFPANGTYTMFMLYGQAEYADFTDAMSALATYSPAIAADIGGGNIRSFIVIKQGTTDLAAEVAAGTAYISGGSLFGTFSGGGGGGGGSFTPDHNSLAGLQGGTSGQYYHLTSAQVGYLPTANEKGALDSAPTALTAANPAVSVADLTSAINTALSTYTVDVVTVTSNGQTSFTNAFSRTPLVVLDVVRNGVVYAVYGTDYTRTGTTLTWLNPAGATTYTTDTLLVRYF